MALFLLLWNLLPLVYVGGNDQNCQPLPSMVDAEFLKFHIPSQSVLYGRPGSKHSVPVRISNPSEESLSLLVYFTETFPVYNLNTFTTHVELVKDIIPSQVHLSANETTEVLVNLHISDYVPPRYRSKVTVIGKLMTTNLSLLEVTGSLGRTEVSFFFTVVGEYDILASYDSVPPKCKGGVMCEDRQLCSQSSQDLCEDESWTSQFLVQDRGTGLGWPESLWPPRSDVEVYPEESLCLGTNEEQILTVSSSCCHHGVALRVFDLAGNMAVCQVGEVPTQGDDGINNNPLLMAFMCSVHNMMKYMVK